MQKNILKTIIWFDLFEYPLKLEEIYFYLISNIKYSKEDILKGVDGLIEMDKIKEKDNTYFLLNRGNIIKTRQERYSESLNKIRRAKRAVRLLSYLPFIRAVFLCNVLGYLNAKKEDEKSYLYYSRNWFI